jgi:hypothetical protein
VVFVQGLALFLWWRAQQRTLRTHRSLEAYCATLWWIILVFFSFFREMEHQWNEIDREKHIPVSLCPPQISHGLSRHRAQATNGLNHGTATLCGSGRALLLGMNGISLEGTKDPWSAWTAGTPMTRSTWEGGGRSYSSNKNDGWEINKTPFMFSNFFASISGPVSGSTEPGCQLFSVVPPRKLYILDTFLNLKPH